MSYVTDNLSKGEAIVATARLHWYIFVPSVVTILIGLALPDSLIRYIVVFFGALGFLRALVHWFTTELAVTNKRIIGKQGLFTRQTMELNHSKVESVTFNQSIVGRIFNFGAIRINGAGSGVDSRGRPRKPVGYISRPLEFRRAANAEIERVEERAYSPAPTQPLPTAANL